MNKKASISIIIALICCLPSEAQLNLFKKPSYKELQQECQRLRERNDSLAKALDTLKREHLEDQRMVTNISPVVEVSNDNIFHQVNRTEASQAADSLTTEFFTTNVPDDELIRRLENIHSYITLPFNSTVKNYMVLYSERIAEKMSRTLGDAKFYFPIFEEILCKYDMPLELKYMAIIESSLKPKAVSRAGAKGMWQFMYNTGKSYGLEINSYVDERMDVWKAADAAARYLQDSYNVYGDWGLAICSYNCGLANVNRAIRTAGKSDFWSIYPYLPRETRGYLPAFVGAMYASVYHKEYNITPANNPMTSPVDTIEIHRKLHFKQIEEVVGVPFEIIDLLNPQYIHQIIPGNCGTYILRLPREWAVRFEKFNNDDLYKYKEDELFSERVMALDESTSAEIEARAKQRHYYYVKRGDTLGKIAARNGVTVRQIMNASGLKSTKIRPKQRLIIPGRSKGRR